MELGVKRDNIFMFIVSIYDNYIPNSNYTKVENYVERKKD